MNNDEFLTSTASNGWLEKWKILYGEVGEVSREIVNAWMERLWELTKDYDPVDIWNINERAAFSMHFQRKKSQARGTNKPKPRLSIAFFVSAAGKKVIEPTVIWRSAKPRHFKNLVNPKRPNHVHYYLSQKPWMTSEIMDSVLSKINRKMASAQRNILFFMDNAPCNLENFTVSYSNI